MYRPDGTRSTSRVLQGIAIAALAAGACVWVLFNAQAKDAPTPHASSDSETRRPSATPDASRTRALEQRVAELEAKLGEPARPSVSASAPSAPAQPDPPAWDEPEDLATRFDDVLAREITDRAWAPDQEQRLRSFFARAGSDAKLDELECRMSMCRLQLRFSQGHIRERFMHETLGLPPLDHGSFFHTDPESGDVTLYALREGYRFDG